MTLPIPKPNETKAQFISRCLSDKQLIKECNNILRRTNIGEARWRNFNGGTGGLIQDSFSHSQEPNKVVNIMSGGYNKPTIFKSVYLPELKDSELIYHHDQAHALWERVKQGYLLDWTFGDLAELHIKIVEEFKKRGIRHIRPVNNLDEVF